VEPDPDQPVIDLGVAGASARREHERRKANREARVRQKHPKTGGLGLALADDPTHETVWARGARGEEIVAAELAKRCGEDVVVLHDRRIPRSRANIDHIAVCATGAWVIDAKRYKGRVVIHKPWFGQAKLKIGGRDQTELIDGLTKQVNLVKTALAATHPDLPVHGAIGFVGDGLPLLGKTSFHGYPILYPKQLAKRLSMDGPLSPSEARAVAAAIAAVFPPA
jgi:hypothetical protein